MKDRRILRLAVVAALASALAMQLGSSTAEEAVPDTVGLVDPAQGLWYLRDADGTVASFFYGNPGDNPIMGDWDCDGIDTPGMYRQSDGFVYLRNSNTEGIADVRFFFGNPGDIPIVGDFNGDGCDTVSIYRPSEGRVFIINQLGENEGGLGAAEFDYYFGNPGDKPFVGDFNGNGIDTIGLHRESTGFVYFRQTHTQGVADSEFFFGDPGDRLVAGDWGIVDGVDTPAIFRPSDATFYFRHTNTQGVADAVLPWGNGNWLPVSGYFGQFDTGTTTTTTTGTTTTMPAQPANPGDAVDCADFSVWADAQAWHDFYFPYYGDVANLDGDADGVACEGLPGAPPTVPDDLGLQWDVAADVTEPDLERVRQGLTLAEPYLADRHGGGIPLATRQGSIVEVIATGTGEFCCTTGRLEPSQPYSRIFFDFAHPHWTNKDATSQIKISVHEYVHSWHIDLGCLVVPLERRLFQWLSEGIAEWLAWETMIAEGYITGSEVDQMMLDTARDDGSLDHSLSEFEGLEASVPVWAGTIGYLAMDRLMMTSAGPSLRDICVETADTGDIAAAFQQVFSITLVEFYTEFDAWAATVR